MIVIRKLSNRTYAIAKTVFSRLRLNSLDGASSNDQAVLDHNQISFLRTSSLCSLQSIIVISLHGVLAVGGHFKCWEL